MALHANIWRKAEAAPFTPEDFLGEGDYQKRRMQREMERRAVDLANAQLAKITTGAPPDEDVPDWAKGPYHGAN